MDEERQPLNRCAPSTEGSLYNNFRELIMILVVCMYIVCLHTRMSIHNYDNCTYMCVNFKFQLTLCHNI